MEIVPSMQAAVIPVGSGRGCQGRVGVGWWVNRQIKTIAVVGDSHHSFYLRCESSQLGVAGVDLGGGIGSKIDGPVRARGCERTVLTVLCLPCTFSVAFCRVVLLVFGRVLFSRVW
jgi:hypothetical protein